jgi:CheY-like chemotaxis protein
MPSDQTSCGGNCRCRQRAERQPELPLLLIVDDDPDYLDTLREALKATGKCRVTTASSAREGLRVLREQEPDAVLADQYMPGRTGTWLLENALKLHPHTRRMIISGRATKVVLQGAMNRAESQHYFHKVRDPRLLIREIIQQVQLAAHRRQLHHS